VASSNDSYPYHNPVRIEILFFNDLTLCSLSQIQQKKEIQL